MLPMAWASIATSASNRLIPPQGGADRHPIQSARSINRSSSPLPRVPLPSLRDQHRNFPAGCDGRDDLLSSATPNWSVLLRA